MRLPRVKNRKLSAFPLSGSFRAAIGQARNRPVLFEPGRPVARSGCPRTGLGSDARRGCLHGCRVSCGKRTQCFIQSRNSGTAGRASATIAFAGEFRHWRDQRRPNSQLCQSTKWPSPILERSVQVSDFDETADPRSCRFRPDLMSRRVRGRRPSHSGRAAESCPTFRRTNSAWRRLPNQSFARSVDHRLRR